MEDERKERKSESLKPYYGWQRVDWKEKVKV